MIVGAGKDSSQLRLHCIDCKQPQSHSGIEKGNINPHRLDGLDLGFRIVATDSIASVIPNHHFQPFALELFGYLVNNLLTLNFHVPRRRTALKCRIEVLFPHLDWLEYMAICIYNLISLVHSSSRISIIRNIRSVEGGQGLAHWCQVTS